MISHVLHGFTFSGKKYEVFQHLIDFKALVETQSGKKIKVLRIDNGGEYVNHEIHSLFHEAGIQLQHTVPYTPQQNEVVEWKNISLKEMESCMLHAKSLPQRLWSEALNCATYIQNIPPIDISRIRPPTRLGAASNRK
jgi:transposase InsO family protein